MTAWVLKFANNCKKNWSKIISPLTVRELGSAESCWISLAQQDFFSGELQELKVHGTVNPMSSLLMLCPILDSSGGSIRVGGRQHDARMKFAQVHPIILPKKHPITISEHTRLLHAGPILVLSSLYHRFHIVGGRQLICFLIRECMVCC